jgi:hypothetical protein
MTISAESAETWQEQIEAWKEVGATHLSVNTMNAGFNNPAAHIDAIRNFREATKQLW